MVELQERFTASDTLPAVVVYEREGGLRPTDVGAARRHVAALADLPGLAGPPTPPLPSDHGEALQVVVPLEAATATG